MTTAAIYGCSGHRLTAEETAFFADQRPWGFILFRRNVDTPDQVRALTAELRAAIHDPNAPILIDQEGGRVQRMGPPRWPKYPPGEAYLKATNDPLAARELARLGARLMAADLRAVGITVVDFARPFSSASDTTSGFIVEPGSKVSVSARLRSCAPVRFWRFEGE